MRINLVNHNQGINIAFRGARGGYRPSQVKKELLYAADKFEIQDSNKDRKIQKFLDKNQSFIYLGAGGQGIVRKIPYTNLAIKSKHSNQDRLSTIDTNLNQYERMNNIVAKGKDNDYTILRYIDGIHSEDIKGKRNLDAYTQIVNNMPQSAYDEYLEKTAHIHMENLFFDTIGDNMIIDIQNSRFEPIDIAKGPTMTSYALGYEKQEGGDEIVKINPIECMYFGIYNVLLTDDNFEFFAKTAIAAAKDCKYFSGFDYDIRYNGSVYQKNKYIQNKITSIYSRLKELHNKKIELNKQGYKSFEIEETLKKQIDKFVADINEEIIPEDDLNTEELIELAQKSDLLV